MELGDGLVKIGHLKLIEDGQLMDEARTDKKPLRIVNFL